MILYQSKNGQLFLISIFSYFFIYYFCLLSNPVKQGPILDQFSMITRPYPRVNGLKTIPFPAAHTNIANKWEYPHGGRGGHIHGISQWSIQYANNTSNWNNVSIKTRKLHHFRFIGISCHFSHFQPSGVVFVSTLPHNVSMPCLCS